MPSLVCHSHAFEVEGLEPEEFRLLLEATRFQSQTDSTSPVGLFKFSKRGGLYRLEHEEKVVCTGQTLELVIEIVRSRVHRFINSVTPENTFLQADTVQWSDGQAIVLIGPSISGKTRLASALRKAGANPWSEHFAIVNAESLILPYPQPGIASKGISVKAIVRAPFRPHATWQPTTMSPGETALRMMEMLGDAGGMTPATMPHLARLASQAELRVAGERGDTDSVVSYLLEHLKS